MIAIAVDDEPLMLGALTKAIKASPDITSVATYTSCEDALDFIKSTPADIAFPTDLELCDKARNWTEIILD